MDTRARTIVKTVVWTLIGLVTMSVVGLIFTGSVSTGGAMALVNASIGFLSYMLYERLWSAIRWGRHV